MFAFKRIRNKLLAFSALALTLLLSAVGVGWYSVSQLSEATQNVADVSKALKQQQTADMMHDAIRGDTLAAMLAVNKGESDKMDAIRAELDDHIKTFGDSMAVLKGLPLDETLRQEVDQILPALENYAKSAEQLLKRAQSGSEVDAATQANFNTQFSTLEDGMEALSDTLAERFDAHTKHAEGLNELAQWSLSGIAALAATVLLVFSVVLARGIEGPLSQAVDMAKAVTAGQLDVQAKVHSSDETAQLLRALMDMSGSLRGMVVQVRSAAEGINTASAEIASGNQDLSVRTEQAASSLQSTASSMDQLTSTVRNSADAARQANQLAASASEFAVRGGQVVSQVVTTMEEINHASRKISDIIGVIDGIAFQTNILALNAAVEAARAGEQGRGFAVVAAEVRNLAQRSAEAAKEIKGLIGASVEKVETGTKLVADAGSTMGQIVGSIGRVSDIVGEITAAAGEQSDGIGLVNTAVNQLDQMTQQNAALVEQSAAAAQSLKDQAVRLSQAVQVFRT